MGRVAHIMASPTAEFVTSLVKRYGVELLKCLTHLLGSAAEAADVAQEAYLRMGRFARPENINNPRAFLFRVATRLATDRLKQRKSSIVPLSEESDQVADEAPLPEARSMGYQALRLLEDFLRELPARQQQVFLMHKILGKTRKEIADELGIAESTVDQHLGRAVAHCRDHLRALGLI